MHRRPSSVLLTMLVAGAIVFVAPASAHTWHVEQDGTGDFTVIQDAVDAASSGDVIAIGPGRYDDYQTVQGGTRWFDVHVMIPDGISLTIQGAGSDETIIGPEDPESHSNSTYGIGGIDDIELVVAGLRIENCNFFSIGYSTGILNIQDCEFYYSGEPTSDTYAIDGHLSSSRISNCRFIGFRYGVSLLSFSGTTIVENCSFDDCIGGIYGWDPGQGNLVVSGCDFRCDNVGIGFINGTSGSIDNCHLEDCILSLQSTGEVTVSNCYILRTDGGSALNLSNDDPVTIVDNIFQSNGRVIVLGSWGRGTITSNQFLRTGSDYWIYCPNHPYIQLDIDLSGNYWGTTDLDEIAAGIWDCHDDDQAYHCVIYEPIADDPVAVEPRSWSEVKSLFRSPGD